MPKPPPRSISGISTPISSLTAACSASTRRAATSNPEVSKIWLPMWEWSPSSRSPGASCTRRTARRASPLAIEKPNFWSSWAVAMYSWVWASTPAVTRIITPVVRPSLPATLDEALDLVEGVDDDPTRTELDSALELAQALVVAVEADPLHREPRPLRDEQLAARADVQREPLLGQPARDGRAQEGLAGVVDVVGGEGVAEGAPPVSEVDLVEDVGR